MKTLRLRFRERVGTLDGRARDDEHIASFRPGHYARQHDDELRIHNPSGAHVATFHGAHAAQSDDDGLHIFTRPRATSRSTNDSLTDAEHSQGLRGLNDANSKFWCRRPV